MAPNLRQATNELGAKTTYQLFLEQEGVFQQFEHSISRIFARWLRMAYGLWRIADGLWHMGMADGL